MNLDEEGGAWGPVMRTDRVSHDGAVNRVRHNGTLAATWSEKGVVHIWDTQRLLNVASVREQRGRDMLWHGTRIYSSQVIALVQLF